MTTYLKINHNGMTKILSQQENKSVYNAPITDTHG